MDDAPKPEEAGGEAQFWTSQIKAAEKKFDNWRKRGDKIVKRYRDERDGLSNDETKFNILWSNVETLRPALFGPPLIGATGTRTRWAAWPRWCWSVRSPTVLTCTISKAS